MSKRYVLFLADSDLTEEEFRSFGDMIKRRHPAAKVIAVKGAPRAVIVKTTNEFAPIFRQLKPRLKERRLESVLTSGAIGNLKRRATGRADHGKVSQ